MKVEENDIKHEIRAHQDIRHALAIDRTKMANERTLMAYLRTGVAMFVAGATFSHISESIVLDIISWILIPLGILISIYGYKRYLKNNRIILEDKRMMDEMLNLHYCRLE